MQKFFRKNLSLVLALSAIAVVMFLAVVAAAGGLLAYTIVKDRQALAAKQNQAPPAAPPQKKADSNLPQVEPVPPSKEAMRFNRGPVPPTGSNGNPWNSSDFMVPR